MPAGTGLQFSARELQSVAKAPSRWRLMTLSPGLNCVTPSPTATISPAASLPGTKGGSGRNWYLPASISTSTYCTPRAAIFTCTSPGPAGGGRDPGAGVEQRGEAVGAPGARAHRAEFDKADAVAGLARRSQMADRKPRETAVAIPHKHRVAQIAGEHRADLGAQIEPVVNLIAQLAGRAFHLGALTFGQLGIARRRVIRGRLCRGGHDRGQKTGVKSELAVQPDMLGALRKREQPGMANAPTLERIAGGCDKPL